MEIERVFFKFPPSPTKGEKMICGPRKKNTCKVSLIQSGDKFNGRNIQES